MITPAFSRAALALSSLILVAAISSAPSRSLPLATAQGANSQGWTQDEQYRWYRGSQGSRLVPLFWLKALEQPGSEELFLKPANVARFGYLPLTSGDNLGLPVGFAVDRTPHRDLDFTKLRWFRAQRDGEPWVGMNCAACHTAEIIYQGKTLRVDGGPTLADFQTFTNDLDEALARTAADPAKFDRFAARVLSNGGNAADRAQLRTALTAFNARQAKLHALNAPEPDYGNGRVDAVGHILNRVAFLNRADGQFGGPADAPVSYPFLWNINQHDFVQWNGIAPNKGAKLPSGQVFDIGALVRNDSEVIGVFADVDVGTSVSVNGYRSSVNVTNLDAMEAQLGRLSAPPWPADWKPLDQRAVNAGRTLFKDHCSSCHAVLERTDLRTPIKAVMTPIFGPGGIGTDPWMACNAFTYQAKSGRLKGVRKAFLFGESRFGEVGFNWEMLVATSVGTLFGKKRQITATAAQAAFGIPRRIQVAPVAAVGAGQASKEDRLRDCRANAGDSLMRYKGRPLNGIWATAPYLHNGSVRTLYELLLPPERRKTEFWVGSREFDPKDIGFVDQQGSRGRKFRVSEGGKPIPGNSNSGHDYGNASFTDDDRYALIEYMKSF